MLGSRILRARRSAPYLVKLAKQMSPENNIGNLDFGAVDGGLHRYELDFIETAEWTKDLLQSLHEDRASLTKMYRKYEETENPICVFETDFYTFDFSKKKPSSEQYFGIKASRLGLSESEKHAFLLIAGRSNSLILR